VRTARALSTGHFTARCSVKKMRLVDLQRSAGVDASSIEPAHPESLHAPATSAQGRRGGCSASGSAGSLHRAAGAPPLGLAPN